MWTIPAEFCLNYCGAKYVKAARLIFLFIFACVRVCVRTLFLPIIQVMLLTDTCHCQRLSSSHHVIISFVSHLLPSTGSEVFPVSRRAANENVEDAHPPTGCVQVLIDWLIFSISMCFFRSLLSITCSIGLHTWITTESQAIQIHISRYWLDSDSIMFITSWYSIELNVYTINTCYYVGNVMLKTIFR